MSKIFSFLFIISISFFLFRGETENLTNIILSESVNAVQIGITLAGGMAFWGGIINIAKKSGYIDIIAKLFTPIIKMIFKSLNSQGKAVKPIVMNIVANLFGLGNAATPLGIEALKEISEEEKSTTKVTKNMAKFIILNTSCVQILPINIATLRMNYGSSSPFEILPCILLTTIISLIFGLLAVESLYKDKFNETS